MNSTRRSTTLALALAMTALAHDAQAHRQWLLPSATVLSGEAQWISVEGAISNDLFFPNHVPMPLAATTATAPSGKSLELYSKAQGKIRSSFELLLDEPGTYRITTLNDMMFASWQEGGETKRVRATPEEMAARDLAGLEGLRLQHFVTRVETIVTSGQPSQLAATGTGLEFGFDTHPNDLFVGETARFRLLLDGEPLAGTEVSIIKGNDRFRDAIGEVKVTSDAEGYFEVTWSEPGRFWMNASARQQGGEFEGHPTARGAAYSLTVEVLPQ